MKAKRNLIIILFLLLFAFMNMAAGEEFSLLIDHSPGPAPNPACYTSDSTYEDDSISVTVESQTVGDSVYHVARIKIASPTQLRTALAGPYGTKKTAAASFIAAENNAVIAVNGDYFQYRSTGFEARQGEVLRNSLNTKLDLLVVDEAGDFHIFKKSDKNELSDFLKEHSAVNAFTFGPALVLDGEVQTIYNSYGFAPQDRAPRVGIGQLGPLEYVLVAVDGRQQGYSRGITIKMLAEFMGELQCQQAFNLDGGGSATMVFGGFVYNSVSGKSERNIYDIIYFASAVPETDWQDAESKEE